MCSADSRQPDIKSVLGELLSDHSLLNDDEAGVFSRDSSGDTALHIAARLGEIEYVKVLLEHGAEVNAAGDMGCTPLHWPARHGMDAMCGLLLSQGASPWVIDEFGESPAEAMASLKIQEAILKRPDAGRHHAICRRILRKRKKF